MAQQKDQRLTDALGELERAVIAQARAAARLDKAKTAVEELAVEAKGESRDEIVRIMSNFLMIRATLRNLKADNQAAVDRQKYADYLESPGWQVTRREALARAQFKCHACGASEVELNVHHLTYVRLGEELPSDLVVLCRPCHRREHGLEERSA